jgi:hypothetical protein
VAPRLSPIASVANVARTSEPPISPLEGEMPGRAEGGLDAHRHHFFFAFADSAFFGFSAFAFSAAFDTFALAALPRRFT